MATTTPCTFRPSNTRIGPDVFKGFAIGFGGFFSVIALLLTAALIVAVIGSLLGPLRALLFRMFRS